MKIVIATGGTGGHLFPALQVASQLREMGHEVRFLGSFSLGIQKIQDSNFPFENLRAVGLTFRSFKGFFRSVWLMARAIVMSVRSLMKWKPDAILGFGGYGAFPVVFSGFFLRIPMIIHEQNVIPGKANRILANFVQRIAISFEKSRKHFSPSKVILTGCPCHFVKDSLSRRDIFQEFNLKEGVFTILVFGGSQGSLRINQEFAKTVKSLKEKTDFQVIHVCGAKDTVKMKEYYEAVGIRYALFEFLNNITHAYRISDLVIARAGAVTVTEIALYQLPAIFIPYPHAQAHQRENALVLCEAKLAQMIEEKDLTVSKLQDMILSFKENYRKTDDMKTALSQVCFPDAAARLARAVIDLKK